MHRHLGLVVSLLGVLVAFSVATANDKGGDVVRRAKSGHDLDAMAQSTLGDDDAAFQATLKAIDQLTDAQTQDLMTRVRRLARIPDPLDPLPELARRSDAPLVTIETRVFEVPRGSFDVSPTAQDPVRYLTDVQVEALLRAAEKNEKIEVIAAPRLTAFSGQDANVSAINQTSFVQDYDVETTKDGSIADPIIGVAQEGLVLDLRPIVSANGKHITVELDGTWSTLARPIPSMEIEVLGEHKVQVQLPEISTSRLKANATMPSGGAALVGGGALVNRDGVAYARMILLRVYKVDLEKIAPK